MVVWFFVCFFGVFLRYERVAEIAKHPYITYNIKKFVLLIGIIYLLTLAKESIVLQLLRS